MESNLENCVTRTPRTVAEYIVGLVVLFTLAATAPAQNKMTAAARRCKEAGFEISLKGGQAYARNLGGGLVLKLAPLRRNWGWTIQVEPRNSGDDYAYPLNPPLRSGNSQALGTGYGETARDQLSHDHDVRFTLNASEYERIFSLASDALWPYQAHDPDKAAQRYLDAIRKARSGLIRLKVRHFATTADGTAVISADFAASVMVPSDFDLAADLKAVGVACGSDVR